MASCWESFASALSPACMRSQREQLLSLRAAEQRLRERAGALQREHNEVVSETAEAEMATLEAETLERLVEANRRVAVMTKEKHEKELPVVINELKVKGERVRVLEAILDTVRSNKRPLHR